MEITRLRAFKDRKKLLLHGLGLTVGLTAGRFLYDSGTNIYTHYAVSNRPDLVIKTSNLSINAGTGAFGGLFITAETQPGTKCNISQFNLGNHQEAPIQLLSRNPQRINSDEYTTLTCVFPNGNELMEITQPNEQTRIINPEGQPFTSAIQTKVNNKTQTEQSLGGLATNIDSRPDRIILNFSQAPGDNAFALSTTADTFTSLDLPKNIRITNDQIKTDY